MTTPLPIPPGTDISHLLAILPQAMERMSPSQQEQVLVILKELATAPDGWPLVSINSDTGRPYKPHHQAEMDFVNDHVSWRYCLASGGEGGGKSVAGIQKDLIRLRAGCDGLMVSPNLPHFQRSTWKEFQRWCPWECVVDEHQRMKAKHWQPVRPFDIVFKSGATLHCVGAKDVGSLEGPNLNFVHFDEARHFPDSQAIKVLDGRVRIDGPNGERPQMWFTTTRRLNWLFDYFGPLKCTCKSCGHTPMTEEGIEGIEVQRGNALICPKCDSQDLDLTDSLASFKLDSCIISLPTIGNAENLTANFAELRAQTLTSAEIDVLIRDMWRVIEGGQPFLPDIQWWDSCKEDLPPLTRREPLILALDAATGRQLTSSDCFAIVGVTPHPTPSRMDMDTAVRYIHTWQAAPGRKIDFDGTSDEPGPIRTLLNLCGFDLDNRGGIIAAQSGVGYRVIEVVYDPSELESDAQRLRRAGVATLKEFSQMGLRYEADRQLLNLIQAGRVFHDGNMELRNHLLNADRKLDTVGRKLRMVKRVESRRIDAAVCLSMGAYERYRLNL